MAQDPRRVIERSVGAALERAMVLPRVVGGAVAGPLAPARELVSAQLRSQLGGEEFDTSPFTAPAGDPGLFGPSSVAWRVHGDIPSMLIGGVSALLLQTLHPKSMAGVGDHSDWQDDPLGRLVRTGTFIGVTTYAATDTAEELIAVIRRVHDRVVGVTPAGEAYEANDPALLTWVHTAEVGSFLRGYQRYSGRPLSGAECDRYFAETAVVAEKLGAGGVPKSRREVRAYFRGVRPELYPEPRAFETAEFLVRGPSERPLDRAAYALVAAAAIDLLPEWARRDLRLRRPGALETALVRPAAGAAGELLRWATGAPPMVAAARARVAGARVAA